MSRELCNLSSGNVSSKGWMMAAKASRATVKDVARVAGVSISSVSRALNGMTANQELVQRVLKAVEEVDYVPSMLGQSLKSQKTGQIALAVPDIANASYLAMFAAAEKVFREKGLRVTVINTGGKSEEDLDVIRSLRKKFVDGLIIISLRPSEELIEEIEASEVPVVFVGSITQSVSFDVVSADSKEAAKLGVEHLVSQGARKLGMLAGPLDTVPGRRRYEGFVDAVSAHGVLENHEFVSVGEFSFDLGYDAAKQLIAKGVDGILAQTDHMALSVLHAVRDEGLSVPLNIRVVGIDNSEAARTALPKLTSIDLGAVERGRLAAEFLYSKVSGDDQAPKTAVVRPRIVVRESSL